jgi:hypothetical protein
MKHAGDHANLVVDTLQFFYCDIRHGTLASQL